MILWYPIAKSLHEHLKTLEKLSGYEIYFGSNDQKNKSMIEVLWDIEDKVESNKGRVTLYVDITFRTDDVDLADGYVNQYKIQTAILDSIPEWQGKMSDEISISSIIQVAGIATTGKLKRPTFPCRMVMLVNWRVSI